jgi:hypothetical protein
MKILTYIVFYDFGFAPNPYFEFCTLATCKPTIRKSANIGDWVMGVASKKFFPNERKLIFAMKVTEKFSFTDYWNNPKFAIKKPVMNSALKRSFGDNIYHFDIENNLWYQADSRHSRENGETNEFHLKRDTSADFVLVSDDFYYFGDEAIEIPANLSDYFAKTQGQKHIMSNQEIQAVLNWLSNSSNRKGILGFPLETKNKKFKRLNK